MLVLTQKINLGVHHTYLCTIKIWKSYEEVSSPNAYLCGHRAVLNAQLIVCHYKKETFKMSTVCEYLKPRRLSKGNLPMCKRVLENFLFLLLILGSGLTKSVHLYWRLDPIGCSWSPSIHLKGPSFEIIPHYFYKRLKILFVSHTKMVLTFFRAWLALCKLNSNLHKQTELKKYKKIFLVFSLWLVWTILKQKDFKPKAFILEFAQPLLCFS